MNIKRKVPAFYSWITTNKKGQSGVTVVFDGKQDVSLCNSDLKSVKQFKDVLVDLAKQKKVTLTLMKFSNPEILEEIKSDEPV